MLLATRRLAPKLPQRWLLSTPTALFFHSTALLAGGGPRNSEHKSPAARLKQKRERARRSATPIVHSSIRLAKIAENKASSVKTSQPPKGLGKKKPRESPSSSITSRHSSSGKQPGRPRFHDQDFIPGVDDFSGADAQQRTKAQGRKRRDEEKKEASKGPTVNREMLPHTESSVLANNVSEFSSVPLNTGLVESLADNLGRWVKPTDIQRLSLSHFFKRNPGCPDPSPIVQSALPSSQTLLASQTGTGKSIAYLLPMLHAIKWNELKLRDEEPHAPPRPLWAPKGLILAPTHELSRQLSKFAKSLCHNIKLRVLCLSQANKGVTPNGKDFDLSHLPSEDGATEFEIRRNEELSVGRSEDAFHIPIDVMVGTAGRVLDLSRGRQWRGEMETVMDRNPWERDDANPEQRTGRPNPPEWKPSLDLSQIEWVVVDEADVVYGPDFAQTTELLLNDIAAAKQQLPQSKVGEGPKNATSYPFHLVLCTATIPNALDHYITANYPSMERLTSIRLHQLPRSIVPEHVPYSGGNRAADVAARIRSVFLEEANYKGREDSKILIFCNRSSKVEGLSQYLNEHDITTVPLIRGLEGSRAKNNDKAIKPFLRVEKGEASRSRKTQDPSTTLPDPKEPRVLVTTSLLSRGLDFSPSVRHVFIVDEPRSMVDFIHRAGRTGRAGQEGKVIIFSKSKGRGSARTMTGVRGEIMKKVGLRPANRLRRPADAFAP